MQLIDLTGKTFGALRVIRRAERRNAKCQAFWVCECACGRNLVVRGDNLRTGNTRQCSECTPRGGSRSDFVG